MKKQLGVKHVPNYHLIFGSTYVCMFT